MKAVFITGGKQYYVAVGDELYVEKLDLEDGKIVDFTEVLLVGDKTGMPFVKGAKVTCEVVKSGKAKKITIFKYKAKKKYRRTQGHRQPYTKLIVKQIVG
ncbi:MAG: 50S ribosomal protein L21 [Bacilli bacterium]|nr:50S ribosomal protein L21 [Bacilli bacterium]